MLYFLEKKMNFHVLYLHPLGHFYNANNDYYTHHQRTLHGPDSV